jgi:hypothetical protein
MRFKYAQRLLTSTLAGILIARSGEAQGGSLTGRVLSDSALLPIVGVEIVLTAAERSVRTDARGAFRISGLRAGRYPVLVRMPGFLAITDTISIVDGAELTKDYRLTTSVTALDSVRVTAPGTALSARMRTFEQRRAEGFGRFITADQLRKNEDLTLRSVLARLPGLRLVTYQSATFAAITRGSAVTNPLAIPWDRDSPRRCWVQVYLDAIRIYSPLVAQPAPNIDDYRVRDLEAVEFYPGSTVTPAELGGSSAPCGTLVLWTRER